MPAATQLPKIARTLVRLKGRQIVGQVVSRARAKLQDPQRIYQRIPEDGLQATPRWQPRCRWLDPDGELQSQSALLTGRYAFVGIETNIGFPPNWRAEAMPKLWRYNLHYHGYIFSLGYAEARLLVLDHIDKARPVRGAEAWEPYPLSLRLINWCCFFYGRHQQDVAKDPEFGARLWLEIRRMAQWLSEHLEYHLLANHLFENAVALSIAGACFKGREALTWRSLGYGLLRREIHEQILPDGGHYERSPMYQQRLLYCLGLLLNTGDRELDQLCRPHANSMLRWLQLMSHPDGSIAHFNDAASYVYPDTKTLAAWLAELKVEAADPNEGEHSDSLEDSGYFTARNSRGDYFVMDAGEIGPSYQPGHAHADFLAIEASFGGHRLVVDGGNKIYEEAPERHWARSVVAHSTVFVDEHEPLELWGSFRVGRRGHPRRVKANTNAEGSYWVEAQHSGYRHLDGRPTPQRQALWEPSGALWLRDTVHASSHRSCTSQLRIDAAWQLIELNPRCVRLRREGIELCLLSSVDLEITPCRHFPRFGRESKAHLLVQRFDVGQSVAWVVARSEGIEQIRSRWPAWSGLKVDTPEAQAA